MSNPHILLQRPFDSSGPNSSMMATRGGSTVASSPTGTSTTISAPPIMGPGTARPSTFASQFPQGNMSPPTMAGASGAPFFQGSVVPYGQVADQGPLTNALRPHVMCGNYQQQNPYNFASQYGNLPVQGPYRGSLGTPLERRYATRHFQPYIGTGGNSPIIKHITQDAKLEVRDDGFHISGLKYDDFADYLRHVRDLNCEINSLKTQLECEEDQRTWIKYLTIICGVLAGLVLLFLIIWGIYSLWNGCSSSSSCDE